MLGNATKHIDLKFYLKVFQLYQVPIRESRIFARRIAFNCFKRIEHTAKFRKC